MWVSHHILSRSEFEDPNSSRHSYNNMAMLPAYFEKGWPIFGLTVVPGRSPGPARCTVISISEVEIFLASWLFNNSEIHLKSSEFEPRRRNSNPPRSVMGP